MAMAGLICEVSAFRVAERKPLWHEDEGVERSPPDECTMTQIGGRGDPT